MGCKLTDFFKKSSGGTKVVAIIAFIATIGGLIGIDIFYIHWGNKLNDQLDLFRTDTFKKLFSMVIAAVFFVNFGLIAWFVWFIFWNFECCGCIGSIISWVGLMSCCLVSALMITIEININSKKGFCLSLIHI